MKKIKVTSFYAAMPGSIWVLLLGVGFVPSSFSNAAFINPSFSAYYDSWFKYRRVRYLLASRSISKNKVTV